VTFGTGNAYQSAAEAIAHPSPWLYTDSEVNLDAATGKLRWYYQGVTNDFMDHDMQTSPIAATVDGQPAVIGSGKMGVVYAMNASTGTLIWKTPVGEHSESDNYPLEAMEQDERSAGRPGRQGQRRHRGPEPHIAIAGNSVLVPAGGPSVFGPKGGSPQLVVYTVR
jgi:glucose dehydrogenase